MMKADSSSNKGGKLLPPKIADPKNVEMLRDLTTELEIKIERSLRSLFTSSVMPWEQWFINAISNPDNRASLGIPNNLEKIDISHLLGGREGFHETFRRTILERLGIIISESLKTIVCHPLAGSGLKQYTKTVETLSAELLRELRWNEFDDSLKQLINNEFEKRVIKSQTPLFDEINRIVERHNNDQDNKFEVKTNIDEDQCTKRVTRSILKLIEVIDDQAAADAFFSPFLSEINIELIEKNESAQDLQQTKDQEQSYVQTEIVNELKKRLNESFDLMEIAWKDIEELTYGYWHSYKDPAMNVVLDTLTRARYDKNILSKKYACKVIDSLVNGYEASVSVNSCLTLLWLCSVVAYSSPSAEKKLKSVIAYSSDGAEEKLEKIIKKHYQDSTEENKKKHYPKPTEENKNAYLSNAEPFLHNKKGVIESLGVLQEFKDKQYIKRVIAVPGAIEVYAFISARYNKETEEKCITEFKQGLNALLENVLCVDNGTHDGQKPLKESDWGHLYFMCNKLDALYSFWIWYHAHLLDSKASDYKKIGDFYYARSVRQRVQDIIDEKDKFKTSCPDSNVNGDELQCTKGQVVKGTDHSVFILGGAGFGKTELVKQMYSEMKENNGKAEKTVAAKMIPLTPLSFAQNKSFYDVINQGHNKDKLEKNHICVVFIDEIHLQVNPSIYARLLVPLGESVKNLSEDGKPIITYPCDKQENGNESSEGGTPKITHPCNNKEKGKSPKEECYWHKNKELNIQFVFASSRYRSEYEFREEALATNNTAMIDFSTRVGHWVSLPSFSITPEQKIAVYKGMCSTLKGDKKPDKNKIILDLSITSAREFKRAFDGISTEDKTGHKNVDSQKSEKIDFYPVWLREHLQKGLNDT